MTSSSADVVPVPGLRWAVKRSFLHYLSRMPDGRISATDGAVPVGDEIVWEPAPAEMSSPARCPRGVVAFAGDLRFGGHGGILFVRLADPWITLRDDAGELSVVDTFGPTPDARLSLVTFEVARREDTRRFAVLSADEVRLTDAGSEVFNKVYPAGELFESFVATWPIDPGPAGS